MGNSFFRFKQFRIDQEHCAMKVCTDSCLLGAYVKVQSAATVLDIGTGTGLLALMVAQKSLAMIDAVEIEGNAFNQAKANFLRSRWKERLNIYHDSIQSFSQKATHTYDLIISNPPFFSNQLKSGITNRNIALHSEALSFEELLKSVMKLLDKKGRFYVLLPAYEFGLLREKATEYNLHVNEVLEIKDRPTLPLLRIIAMFSFEKREVMRSQLVIKEQEGNYSEAFIGLLKDYYLHF